MSDHDSPPVAVITGASSGIGAATASALSSHGYRVALLARRVDRLQQLAAELGDTAVAIAADVTDRDALLAAADQVQHELGGADVLVNNAGMMLLGPFGTEQRAEARRMVEVNLLGAMTATEVFLPQLRDGGGDLINISSVAGRTARAGNAAYAATKWGMNGWSEALRQELQPDIRVTVIEPGAVATELTDHITDPSVKQNTEQFYAQLAITAEDVADVIAFAVTRPRRMTLNEILLRPTAQPSSRLVATGLSGGFIGTSGLSRSSAFAVETAAGRLDLRNDECHVHSIPPPQTHQPRSNT
jgi:NADP-dependent 3-hydroxy acid dehydrogenase YdfG